jgi:PhoD related phosphatase
MAAPYWGNLDPPAVTRQNTVRRSSNGADRDSMQSQSAQSKTNRISVQSQAPTASTQSPFVSPTASSFQAEGLAPRPPSFPYGAPEGVTRDYLERRRRRASRDTEQYDDSRDSVPPPAAPDVPRPPPISYKEPYNAVGPPTYPTPIRSRSTRRSEGPIDANQTSPIDHYQERRAETINGRHGADRRELNTGSEHKGDRASNSGHSGDPNRGTIRRSVGARKEKSGYHDSAAPPRTRKESTIDTETQRRREWAPDRSPLQRLELTLDSITKEEKRARAEEAELLAREAEAGRGGDRVNPNSVRFRDRPIIKGPEKGTQPKSQSSHEADQVKSLDSKQNDELQRSGTVEKKQPVVTDSEPARQLGKGFEYQPQRVVTGTGTGTTSDPEKLISTQRGKSFRERAALPVNMATPNPPINAGIIRSASNKLKKDPPGDPWFNRRLEAEMAAQLAVPRKQSTDVHREPSRAGGPLNSAPVTTGQKRAVTNTTLEKQDYGTPPPMEAVGSNSDEHLPHVPIRKNSSKKTEQLTGHQIAAGPIKNIPSRRQQSYTDRPNQSDEPGPKRSQENNGPEPRTETKTAAPPDVAEGNSTPDKAARRPDGHHHFPNITDLNRHRRSQYQPGAGIYAPSQRLDEWKNAGVAALTGALLDLEIKQTAIDKDKAWWEENRKGKRRLSTTKQVNLEGYDGVSEGNNGMAFPVISTPATEDKESTIPRISGEMFQEDYDSNGPFPELCTLVEGTGEGDTMALRGKSYFRQHIFTQSKWGLSSRALNFLQTSSLSSYSSNCPKLSKHNIFHPFHICPIQFKALSKRLTDSTRPIRVDFTTGQTQFKPPLFLKCGPLLRYCGMRQDLTNSAGQSGTVRSQEIWRGSVLIVTMDSRSSYEKAPVLRLFSQPMDLLPPPPQQVGGAAGELAPEYVDPIAGLTKVGRDGRTLFVRPVEQLDEGKDLSGRDDFDDGIFEAQPDQAPGSHDKATDPSGSFAGRSRKMGADGEKLGKYAEVKGFRLHAEQGSTFWRFNIEVELQSQQQRIAYRINQGPVSYFWVPGQGQSMNIMFYSCNGFSLGVNTDQFSGPDPMWRDVLNTHQTQPFHVMIGGGDQIYNDLITEQTEHFREWLIIRNPLQKHNAPFTSEMQKELEAFYFERYSMWFSQGLFGLANSQIPMVNILDDHDIIDGFGSYPHHFMDSPVFTGLGAIAFKYYMLFQHQSIIDEGEETEPSWLLGLRPGPYIKELSRSVFMFMGTNIAFLGLDCRTERSYEDVVSDETYTKIFDRLRREIVKGQTKHLIILLSVPIAYPRLVWLENM